MINIGNPYNWRLLNDSKCKWTEEYIENYMPVFDELHANENFEISLFNIIDYGLIFDLEAIKKEYENPNYFHKQGIKKFFNGKTKNEPRSRI